MIYTIKNSKVSASVGERGAELVSLKIDGKEIMWQSPSESFWSKHAPLLFPFCGRLKDKKYSYRGKTYDMTAHGFISKELFKVRNFTASSITLVSKANEKTLEIYPFSYEFVAEYVLTECGVSCKVTVKNAGEDVMPYMFGWHPGFTLPEDGDAAIDDYKIEFGPETESIRWTPLQNLCFARPYDEEFKTPGGSYVFNESEIYKNDTMIFSSVPKRTKLSSSKNTYSVTLDASENTPYFCIWKEPKSEARFICLEPWSSLPADGDTDEQLETRKMARLAPGAQECFTLDINVTV